MSVVFLDFLGLGMIAPLLSVYASELGADMTHIGIGIGLLFSLRSVVRLLLLPIVGDLSDRTGKKKIFIVLGLIVFILTAAGYFFAQDFKTLLITRLFQGAASTMFYPIILSYVGELAADGKEGEQIGPINMASFIGMGAGPLMGGLLMDFVGDREVFIAMGLLSLIGLVMVLLYVPETNSPRIARKGKKLPIFTLLSMKPIWGVITYRFLNAFLRGGMMSFVPLLAITAFGLSPTETGLVIAANTVVVGLLQPRFGKMSDRRSKVHMIIYGNLIASVALIFLAFTGSFIPMILCSLVIGVSSAMAIAAAQAIGVQIGKSTGLMSSTMSLFAMSMSFGLSFSPLLSGAIMDAYDLIFVFPVCGFIVLFGTCVIFVLIKDYASYITVKTPPTPAERDSGMVPPIAP